MRTPSVADGMTLSCRTFDVSKRTTLAASSMRHRGIPLFQEPGFVPPEDGRIARDEVGK
jgi:hypothetical protein